MSRLFLGNCNSSILPDTHKEQTRENFLKGDWDFCTKANLEFSLKFYSIHLPSDITSFPVKRSALSL